MFWEQGAIFRLNSVISRRGRGARRCHGVPSGWKGRGARRFYCVRPVLAALAATLFAGSCGATGPDSEIVPLGMLPEGAAPVHYRIALTIVPEDERFSGRTEIDVRGRHARRHGAGGEL